ncbi:MAG: HesA/MoeB/ThiF family protein [Myxococcales bacterium]|nr:HesA/MoeB/ThiF family protein [Myxococcales bacterium]
MADLADSRVLLVGAGGLGSAAGQVLARAGVGHLTVADDDVVDLSNLQRQTLYREADAGQPKAPLAARRLQALAAEVGHEVEVVAREMRVLPDGARELAGRFDLVVEGGDNFATKFLVADACALAGVPVVQAGAVRWVGWALASIPGESACLRCVFEDVPSGPQDTCAAAGVIGPVVGVLGAIQGALALSLLVGRSAAAGVLHSYRGLSGQLRRSAVPRQQPCPLCRGDIEDTDVSRYLPPDCAA